MVRSSGCRRSLRQPAVHLAYASPAVTSAPVAIWRTEMAADVTLDDETHSTLTSALPGATARVVGGDPVPVPWAR